MITLPETKTIILSRGKVVDLWHPRTTITIVPAIRYMRIFKWETADQTEWFFIHTARLNKLQQTLIRTTQRDLIESGTCQDYLPLGLIWYQNPYSSYLGSDTGTLQEQLLVNNPELQFWFKAQTALRFTRREIVGSWK